MPYLSVVIPAYNSEATIEDSLKSVRQSSCRDYELIVVDCGSRDETTSIAKKYADKIIELAENDGRSHARSRGIKNSNAEIIVNIDSDVVIRPDTLTKINGCFSQHPEIDAITGMLSKDHPYQNFFSQYKNLYMHYIFSKLPERVTFLYGSIHAIRKNAIQVYDSDIETADDTALGQKLLSCGKRIAFLKDLEVIHLKRYNLFSFIKNDFQIPFDWARIFLKYKGWKQLGKHGTGYAHSPKEQLMSVILAPTILLLIPAALFGYLSFYLISPLILGWFFLNFRFFAYLTKEKGIFFGTLAIFVTFVDNTIMALGILSGLVSFLISKFFL